MSCLALFIPITTENFFQTFVDLYEGHPGLQLGSRGDRGKPSDSVRFSGITKVAATS
jgi:hypothetical protein